MSRHFGGLPSKGGLDNRKILLILSVFFLAMFIILAIFLVKQGSSSTGPVIEKRANTDINMVEVLVPIRKIEQGEKLRPSMFKVELRSRFGLSDGYITDLVSVNNNYARTLIVPGQPLYHDYITKFAPTSPIVGKIPEGYRAVSIRVDDISSIEGWARPGSIVDIQWVAKINGQDSLKVIVEKAQVLSAEKTVNTEQTPGAIVPSTVTLLVTADDAKKITLAQSNGKLFLVLRNPEDESIQSDSTITPRDLHGYKPSKPTVVRRQAKGSLTVGGTKYCVGLNGELFKPEADTDC